jgi:hypothetical protein
LRGQTKPARHKRRLDLDLGKCRDQGAAPQPFFQGPGGVLGVARLDQKKERRVEAKSEEARSIRTPPFPRGLSGKAPQHQIAALDVLGHGDQGQGEAERCRVVAVGFGPDLMESPAPEMMPEWYVRSPSHLVGEGREGGQPCILSLRFTPLRAASGACSPTRGERKRMVLSSGWKRAGGAGKGRARCGGDGQRHGNLLERADLRA